MGDQVQRVAQAIWDNLPVDNRPTLEQCHYPAVAAIAAMQADPIPIYRSRDATDDVLGEKAK